MTQSRIHPLRIAASLVIDYLRWTQLTPMITVWGFGILMLGAMVFVNNQELAFDSLARVAEWLSELPWIGETFSRRVQGLADEKGVISLGGAELESLALRAWAALSLGFMALALIAGLLFGRFEPWPLRRKLGVAAIACVMLLVGFVAIYFANSAMFNGTRAQWILMFSGVALLVFVVNAWCLSIAHLLSALNRSVLNR